MRCELVQPRAGTIKITWEVLNFGLTPGTMKEWLKGLSIIVLPATLPHCAEAWVCPSDEAWRSAARDQSSLKSRCRISHPPQMKRRLDRTIWSWYTSQAPNKRDARCSIECHALVRISESKSSARVRAGSPRARCRFPDWWHWPKAGGPWWRSPSPRRRSGPCRRRPRRWARRPGRGTRGSCSWISGQNWRHVRGGEGSKGGEATDLLMEWKRSAAAGRRMRPMKS